MIKRKFVLSINGKYVSNPMTGKGFDKLLRSLGVDGGYSVKVIDKIDMSGRRKR